MKSFARVDSTERRRVDLNEHLRDTVKLTQAEFRRRIEVTMDLGELPEVECYPQMLNQVFLNLLVNAGQAIEGAGTIAVRTRLEGGMVHISHRRQRPRHDCRAESEGLPRRLHHQAGRRRAPAWACRLRKRS